MVDRYGKKSLLARLEVNGIPQFQGVITVRKDSTVKKLNDLVGKRFAFGDPDSTMSYLVPRYMLLKEGIHLNQLPGYMHLQNHNNVALGVLAGTFDAGALKQEVFDSYKHRGLKELAKTPKISEHVFIATHRFPESKIENIRQSLMNLSSTAEGKKILTMIKQSATNLVEVHDEDYDNLRTIMRTLKKEGVTH